MDFSLIQTAVRYAAMIFAGWLVSKGWADESLVEPIVGLVLALAAIVWFLVGKYFPEKRAPEPLHEYEK